MSDAPTTPPSEGPEQQRAALRLRYTALSDVGRVRKDNQDSGYAGPYFLAVADGVGGSARGDVASSAAIEQLRTLDVVPGADPQAEIAEAIDAAHHRIAGLVEQHPELDGTSTTVTAVLFDGTRLAIGHVGDSRGYLMRGGRLVQLTKDHTFVQTLVDEGRITEAESRVHPHRNLILRAVDGVHESEPDLSLLEVEPGDRIMLCSDGASGVLDDQDLADLLVTGTVENAARTIIAAALDGGSTDNVTVVVADLVDAEAVDPEDPDETQAMQVGPIVVGAAVERRRGLGRRRARHQDTGELDAVLAEPAEDGGPPVPVDPESVRYAPRAPRRFAWLRRLAVLAVVVILVWVGLSAAYDWSQRQYYVAASDDGKVAIYQGVETELPFVTLNHVYAVSATNVSDLPDFNKGQVRDGMTTKNLQAARALVDRLTKAAACETQAKNRAAQPKTSPTPTATPTRTGTKRPGATRTPRPTRSPSGAASPTSSPTSAPSTPSGSAGSCDT